MITEIIHEKFLDASIEEYKGGAESMLSDKELLVLIDEIKSRLDAASLPELEQSTLFYWLTHGLSQAMENKNSAASYKLAALFYEISEKYPHLALTMLGETIEYGEFKGQTGAFVWMNRFYGATFYSIFSPTLIVINSIFSHLLKQDSSALSQIMIQPMESGFSMGQNALLNLIYALKNTTEYDLNQPTTQLIAELLAQFMIYSPGVLRSAITQEITRGAFSGTNPISFIVATLIKSSKDDIDTVKTICDVLLMVNESHSQLLMASFTKIAQKGYNKGMHPFHFLLTGLVSAAYVEQNTQMVNVFVTLIHAFLKKSPDIMSTVLTTPIEIGERKGENGIMHLVHALITAMTRNIDTAAITRLLVEVIEHHDPDLLEQAFNSRATSKNNHYLNTPLLQLENKFSEEKTTPTQKMELEDILSKLTQIHHVYQGYN